MDVTALARSLLEPVPAHGAAGLEVLRAGHVRLERPPPVALTR
jgi:hypothetical protein